MAVIFSYLSILEFPHVFLNAFLAGSDRSLPPSGQVDLILDHSYCRSSMIVLLMTGAIAQRPVGPSLCNGPESPRASRIAANVSGSSASGTDRLEPGPQLEPH